MGWGGGLQSSFFFSFSLFCLVGRSKMKPIPTSRAGLFSIVKMHYLKFNETARKLLAIFRPRTKLSIVVIVLKRDFLCRLMTRSWNSDTVGKKPPIRSRLTSQLAKPGSSNFWNFLNENTTFIWGLVSRSPWDGGGGGGVLLPFEKFQYLLQHFSRANRYQSVSVQGAHALYPHCEIT